MTKRWSLCATAVIAMLLPGATIRARQQPPATQAKPAQAPAPAMMGMPQGPPSPEILPDNRVTLRLMAPNTTEDRVAQVAMKEEVIR